MIGLRSRISQIEKLIEEGDDASITYAALECRLAIEGICYERLRVAHDYISHDDLKKWAPRDIVRILIQEVDSKAATSFTLSVSRSPIPDGAGETALEQHHNEEFIAIGEHVGFDPQKLGALWNALANLALHISLPVTKADRIQHYGDSTKIRKKVIEALAEIKRINTGTLIWTGFGKDVSFVCLCGAKNRRRLELLNDGQTVSCIDPNCDETYSFVKSDLSFGRRVFDITCKTCNTQREVPKKMFEKTPIDKHIYFSCEGCGETIYLAWRPMQAQSVAPAGEK